MLCGGVRVGAKWPLVRDIASCWSVIPEKNVLGQKGNVRTGLQGDRVGFSFPCSVTCCHRRSWLNRKHYPKICRAWFLSSVWPLAHGVVTGLGDPICKARSKRSLRFRSALSVSSPQDTFVKPRWPCCPFRTDVETQRKQRVRPESHGGYKVNSDFRVQPSPPGLQLLCDESPATCQGDGSLSRVWPLSTWCHCV